MPYKFISQQADLDTLSAHLLQQDAIAIDTEFVRVRSYFPKLGLVQVNCGEQIYLIDPLEITDWTAFAGVLASPKVVKVIHSCSEDVEVFKVAMGVKVVNFFDTQVAEAHLNKGNSLGLAVLVKRYHDIDMDKGQARTDWLQRPLSEQQLVYAADDVRWLLPIYQQQKSALAEHINHVMADVNLVIEKKHVMVSPPDAWRDIKCNWQFSPRELAILKELVQWRLENAIARDLALNFVVNERTLVLLTERMPSNINSMKNIPGIHPMEIRKHGQALIACIERGKAVDINDCPPRIPRLAESAQYKALFSELKKALKTIAETAGVSPELLATKRMINQYIAYQWQFFPWLTDSTPELLMGWRKDLIEETLAAIMVES